MSKRHILYLWSDGCQLKSTVTVSQDSSGALQNLKEKKMYKSNREKGIPQNYQDIYV